MRMQRHYERGGGASTAKGGGFPDSNTENCRDVVIFATIMLNGASKSQDRSQTGERRRILPDRWRDLRKDSRAKRAARRGGAFMNDTHKTTRILLNFAAYLHGATSNW